MRRRMAARKPKLAVAGKQLHPRDREHPDHGKWLKKMRQVQKTRWAKMSATERQGQIAKMAAGRGYKPTVRMAS